MITAERMKAAPDQRFRFGVAVSLVWLLLFGALLLLKWPQLALMPPNEWGDFLAGWFSPLALLWLVLGYMQQGVELKLNTEALLLQAEELRHSVDQQRSLVEVSRLQLEGEREALQLERIAREEAFRPRFAIAARNSVFAGSGQCYYNAVLVNSGHTATRVRVLLRGLASEQVELAQVPVLLNGAQQPFQIITEEPLSPDGCEVVVRFVDGIWRESSVTFRARRSTDHPQSDLEYLLSQ